MKAMYCGDSECVMCNDIPYAMSASKYGKLNAYHPTQDMGRDAIMST